MLIEKNGFQKLPYVIDNEIYYGRQTFDWENALSLVTQEKATWILVFT